MRIRLNHSRLLELIAKSTLSQNHWALRLGLSRGHWSGIVKGKHPYPSQKTRQRILEAFGVAFEELFAYEADAGADADFQAGIAERYLIEAEVGQGGMGTVFRARDVKLARTVALKMISPEAVSGIGSDQFLKEIRYTARLRHHHILPVHDAGESAGAPYFVMPLLEDGSLRALLARSPRLPLETVRGVVRGVAAALQHAHDRQVLHCDVKPENVLLSVDHAYVADFGIARVIHAEAFEWGVRNEIDSSAGTPAYVSPEQASGEQQLDGRSDVYSLACMVFEMLAGRPPFEGRTTMEIVSKRFAAVPDLASAAPHVPRSVANVVTGAMAVDPAYRPPSAAAFASQFELAAAVNRSPVREGVTLAVSRLSRTLRRTLGLADSPRRNPFMETVRRDLGFAWRALYRQPGYTLLTILTLALGIGANTAIFSVVNRVLLRPLPFPDSQDVMVMWEQDENGGRNQVSPPNYFDWRERNQSFAVFGFSWFSGWATIAGRSPTRVLTESVSRDFWEVFQATPYLGRTIDPDENRPGGDATAVVSHGFWLNHLGADSSLRDATLEVRGTIYEVVGVMPPEFRYQGDTDIWLPAERGEFTQDRTTHFLRVIGRLAPGRSVDDARRDMNAVARQVRIDAPESAAVGVLMIPMHEQLVGDTRRPLYLLLGAASLLLLIGCTNVASTLLAQGSERQREIAIRTSLGAGRGRIVRQLLTESVLLAALGAAAGLAMAAVVVRALGGMAPAALTRIDTIRLDVPVVIFAVCAGAVTALLFGLLPALRGSEADANTVLRSGSTGIMSGRSKLWGALVGTEVAFALLLLVGSGLLMRSFWTLMNVDMGFEPEGVLTVEVSLPESRYAFGQPVGAFHERFLAEMATVPGVTAAGIINHLPLGGLSIFAGIATQADPAFRRGRYRMASPGLFEAMGIPILRGRGFTNADRPGVTHAIVLNQTLARELFAGADPLGQQVMLSGNDAHAGEWLTVVGVAADVRHTSLTAYEPPAYYVNYLQRPAQGRTVVAALRTDGDPTRLIPVVQQRLRNLDDQVPAQFAAMTSVVSQSVADRRFTIAVLGAFAGVALILAMMGIFGVVSYTVSTRTRELGIRLALGAEPGDVRNMVMRQSMATVGLGLLAGTVIAVVLTRLLRNMLFEVNPTDPATFAAVALVLAGAAWLASYLPARRSTRIDPMETIRTE